MISLWALVVVSDNALSRVAVVRKVPWFEGKADAFPLDTIQYIIDFNTKTPAIAVPLGLKMAPKPPAAIHYGCDRTGLSAIKGFDADVLPGGCGAVSSLLDSSS
jgi:hypothetical protein